MNTGFDYMSSVLRLNVIEYLAIRLYLVNLNIRYMHNSEFYYSFSELFNRSKHLQSRVGKEKIPLSQRYSGTGTFE